MRQHLLAIPLLALLAAARTAHCGDSLAVVHDGLGAEWGAIPVHALEPAGDAGANGADFVSLKVANDGEAMYLLLTVAGETLFQETTTGRLGNDTTLYLDGDANPATGRSVGGIGAELALRFGDRAATVYSSGGFGTSLSVFEAGYVGLPTHTAETFEIRVPYRTDSGTLWRTSANVDFYFFDSLSSDRFPNSGSFRYAVSPDPVAAPAVIPIARAEGTGMRLLVQNILNTAPKFDPEPFARILNAVKPDVVAWQEVRENDWDDADIHAYFDAHYPAPAGRVWTLARNSDSVTMSSWPVLDVLPLSGNHAVHIDLPDDVSDSDLVLFNAHTPCCNNDSGRDFEHDQISSTWRDLLNGTGPFAIDPGSTVVMAGDFNMVGFRRQLETMRDGLIIDNGTWGPDFSPGRADGSLAEVLTRHTHTRRAFTWYSPGSAFGPGRLDWVLYSEDSADVLRQFVLFTPDMTAPDLAAAGLQAGDSLASDHMPIVVDFAFRSPGVPLDAFAIR